METILSFDLSTNPFPLQASPAQSDPTRASKAILTIIATNKTEEDVALQGISIRIPVGTGSGQLTNAAAGISASAPTGWNPEPVQYPEGGVLFAFTAPAKGEIESNTSLNFVFNNVYVNEQTGTVEIKITEAIKGGGVQKDALFVTKFPYGWGKVEFSLNPAVIEYGGGTRLKWKGPEKATYRLEYYSPEKKKIVKIPKAGDSPLSNDGTWPPQAESPLILQQSNVFTLNVTETIGTTVYSAQDQKIVIVGPPPPPEIEWLKASDEVLDFATGPKKVTLTWKTKNAAHLEVQGFEVVTGKEKTEITINNSTLFALQATSNFHDPIMKTVQVQSIPDMLSSNTFEIVDNEVIGSTRPDLMVKDLTEKFSFDSEGNGKYYYNLISRWPPAHERVSGTLTDEVDFTWTKKGTRITVVLIKGATPIVFQVISGTLQYVSAYPLDIHRSKTGLRKIPLPVRRLNVLK